MSAYGLIPEEDFVRRFVMTLGLVLLIEVLALGQTIIKPDSNAKATPLTATEQQRITAKRNWIADAQLVYQRTQDPEAKMVLDMILSNTVAVAPAPQGIKFLEAARPGSPWTALLPMISSDQMLVAMQPKFSGQFLATYQQDLRVMFVREYLPTSQIFRGLMLLHEAHHAGDLLYQPYDSQNPQMFAAKERDVHNFQNRLMSKLGGARYKQLLDAEVRRLRAGLLKNGLKGVQIQPGGLTSITFPRRTPYNPGLDEALTPALSQMEKDTRQTHFWFHAIFTLYEQDRSPVDAEAGKANILLTLYREAGILSR